MNMIRLYKNEKKNNEIKEIIADLRNLAVLKKKKNENFKLKLEASRMSITWDEVKTKYPEYRDQMSEEREMEFVNDCFECYEQEGFAKKFWSPFSDYKARVGQNFEVVERCSTKDSDLSSLPMWNIKFQDGTIVGAYPEEIIPSEMKNNGCTLNGIE